MKMSPLEKYELLLRNQYQPTVPQFQMNKTNWRPIVYTCMIIATKYWEDKYFWNIDVVRKLKLFNLQYTNKYENIIIAIT